MADEQQTLATPAAPAAASVVAETPVSAPVVAESAPAPVVEGVLGDAPAEVIVPEAAPEVTPETKPEVAPEVKEGEKPATETPVEGEAAKPAEVVLPTYEEFKLPDGIALDKEQLGSFNKILGEIETGKLDHAGMQEAGQKLVDLATKATMDSINRLNDHYVQLHETTKKARLEALKADPELGGDKFVETVSTLQNAIKEYGGTEAQIAEFRKEVVEAGLDASPALCRVLFNMQQKINKYTTEGDTAGAQRMVPGRAPAPSKVKDYQRFYAGGNS